MDQEITNTYAKTLASRAEHALNAMQTVQDMEIRMSARLAAGDRLGTSRRFIPMYLIQRVLDDRDDGCDGIDDGIVDTVLSGIVRGDVWEQPVRESLAAYAAETLKKLSEKYTKVALEVGSSDTLDLTSIAARCVRGDDDDTHK